MLLCFEFYCRILCLKRTSLFFGKQREYLFVRFREEDGRLVFLFYFILSQPNMLCVISGLVITIVTEVTWVVCRC